MSRRSFHLALVFVAIGATLGFSVLYQIQLEPAPLGGPAGHKDERPQAAGSSSPEQPLFPLTGYDTTPRDSAGYITGRQMPHGFKVLGIDISRYQGEIDWSLVKTRSQVAFVYMKSTEGATLQDVRFLRNWTETARVGIKRGAYHFYTLCRSERSQFRNLKGVVPVDPAALPIAVDIEFHGNCNGRPSVRRLRRDLARFAGRIREHYGRRPIYYVTTRFHDHYIAGSRFDKQLWVTDVTNRPVYGLPWLIWQYTARGSVPGIEGPVDRNVFNGSSADFQAWAASAGR